MEIRIGITRIGVIFDDDDDDIDRWGNAAEAEDCGAEGEGFGGDEEGRRRGVGRISCGPFSLFSFKAVEPSKLPQRSQSLSHFPSSHIFSPVEDYSHSYERKEGIGIRVNSSSPSS